MSEEFKRPEHTDIIVHWTGRDIDSRDPEMNKMVEVPWRKFPLKPIERPSLIKDETIITDYVERLRSILKFGLWMKDDGPIRSQTSKGCSQDDGRILESPDVARVCFTELKLSEARQHAFEYGRLGIGLKRMFLFDRAGQPMMYAIPIKGYLGPNWFLEILGKFDDKTQLFQHAQKSFYKYMSEAEDLNYKYYAESEWRIVYPEGLNQENQFIGDLCKKIVDINGNPNDELKKYLRPSFGVEEFKEYIDCNKSSGLKYLIPLDYWFAVIIYPCPTVKIAAERDCEIRRLLRRTRFPLKQQLSQICVGEKYMMPMEIDLDTMSHF